VKTPKTVKISTSAYLDGGTFSRKNFFAVLSIENHEFKKKNRLEFLDKTCNFYEFSKRKHPRPSKLSHSLVMRQKSKESRVN